MISILVIKSQRKIMTLRKFSKISTTVSYKLFFDEMKYMAAFLASKTKNILSYESFYLIQLHIFIPVHVYFVLI